MEHAHREGVGLFKPPSGTPQYVHRPLGDDARVGGVSIVQSIGPSIMVSPCSAVKSWPSTESAVQHMNGMQ